MKSRDCGSRDGRRRIILRGAFGFVGSAFRRRLERDAVPFECLTHLNRDALLPGDVDLFIDCGGNSRKYLADRDPAFDRQRNVLAVAETLERFRPRRYVLLSSSAVYSDVSSVKTTAEVESPIGEVSTYGRHKREAEALVRDAVARPLILRPAGFFGPGLHKGPVYDFLEVKPPFVAPESRMQLLDVDLFAARALELAEDGGTFNAVPEESTVLCDALPGEAAAQRRLAAALDSPVRDLPVLDFRMQASAFGADGGTRLFRLFAQRYMMREGRAECRVFLLAGGRGTRLGGDVPKPAVTVAGKPLAAHALGPFVEAGYDRFYALLGHRADEVANALRGGLGRDHVDRFVETEPLGTGGAVLRGLERTVKPTVLIANADTVFAGFDPERLVKHHVRANATATLLAVPATGQREGGYLDITDDGRVRALGEAGGGRYIHAGCAVVDRARFLEAAGGVRPCSLERDLFASLIPNGDLHAHVDREARYVDAGTPDGLAAAADFVEERQS